MTLGTGSAYVDVIAPREIIIPSRAAENQNSTANAGTLVISGATLAFHDGTKWRVVTST